MHDVRHVFRAAGLNLTGYHSGTIHKALGLQTAGHVHDSGWDVTSLFLSLRSLLPTSQPADRCLRRALCAGGSASAGHAAGARRSCDECQIGHERPAASGRREHPGAVKAALAMERVAGGRLSSR